MGQQMDLTGVLTEDQIIQLLRKADEWLSATARARRRPQNPHWRRQAALFVWVALTTGLRASEVLRMRWDWVNLETKTAKVLRHKKQGSAWKRGVRYSGAKPSTIDLVGPLVERLRRFAKPAGYIFNPVASPNREKPEQIHGMVATVRVHCRQLLLEAGVPIRRVHDFRHTAAVMLFRKTRNVFAVQEMLGHSDLQTSCIYMRHVERPTASALESLFSAI